MASPISVDLPHRLGAAEAKRRIDRNIGRLTDHLPAGARVEHRWAGDRMLLDVTAVGQEAGAAIEVHETIVRVEVTLPAFLSFFQGKIEGLLRRHGGELLEDRSGAAGSGTGSR
jgi:putative polyhydroxyalkanoate system protein